MDAAVAAAGGRVKHSTHRDLISGKKKGPLAQAALWGLSVASFFYGAAVRIRNRAFDLGLLRSHRAPVPVVSIGNLTAGGTGKTPMVAALAEWFTSRGVRPVILSRGYRSLSDAVNDEKLVLDQLCPNVVHLQSPDRVASAAEAYAAHGAEVLLLDDGFQHRRLARDLDIVLIDALDPWGWGHLLPRGLLREPRTALKRADLVLLTRADQCADKHKKRLLNEIRAAWNGRLPVEVIFRPVGLINSAGETRPIDSIAGPVAAFCGIGNPEAFRRSLETGGFQGRLLGPRAFEDHHHYAPSDLAALADWAQSAGASALITTHKDLVKIPRTDLGGVPLWALAIRAEITAGREELESQLRFFLPNAAQKKESSPPSRSIPS
jgi:tetraacyldisaccharide 4'-kinase